MDNFAFAFDSPAPTPRSNTATKGNGGVGGRRGYFQGLATPGLNEWSRPGMDSYGSYDSEPHKKSISFQLDIGTPINSNTDVQMNDIASTKSIMKPTSRDIRSPIPKPDISLTPHVNNSHAELPYEPPQSHTTPPIPRSTKALSKAVPELATTPGCFCVSCGLRFATERDSESSQSKCETCRSHSNHSTRAHLHAPEPPTHTDGRQRDYTNISPALSEPSDLGSLIGGSPIDTSRHTDRQNNINPTPPWTYRTPPAASGFTLAKYKLHYHGSSYETPCGGGACLPCCAHSKPHRVHLVSDITGGNTEITRITSLLAWGGASLLLSPLLFCISYYLVDSAFHTELISYVTSAVVASVAALLGLYFFVTYLRSKKTRITFYSGASNIVSTFEAKPAEFQHSLDFVDSIVELAHALRVNS
eukprot:m.18064 g.18064  ORF g.18064 m.18064 type:complete len:417 (-) comp11815_c0_seq1:80-1330(-)